MLVVEPLQAKDLGRVAKVAHESLSQRYGPEWVRQHIETGRCTCLVAREVRSDEVVGFALAEEDEACEGHLLALAVDRSRRGLGIGSALLREVQDQMCRHGALRLSLDVRADDPRARGFYQRHGFAPEGLVEGAYDDGEGAIHMARPLR